MFLCIVIYECLPFVSQVTSTVPLYFQVTQNAKIAVAGARLLPGLVAYAIGGLLAGILIAKYVFTPLSHVPYHHTDHYKP